MGIAFHYAFSCPACRAVLILAKQLDIKFDLVNVDLMKGTQFSDEFIKINPQKLVPVIVDKGFVLGESRAIMTYLVNQYNPGHRLYPVDAKKRATIDRVMYLTAELFNRARNVARPVFYENIWPPKEDAKNDYLELLKVLERMKLKKKFLASDDVSLADISCINDISAMNDVIGLDIRSMAPGIAEWREKMKEALPEYDMFVAKPVAKLKSRLDDILASKVE